jgi:outer membrane protein assembly factor BamB
MLDVVRWAAVALTAAAPIVVQSQSRPDPSLMFRGNPAHTGVAPGRLFGGQGGVKWRFQTGDAVRSTPAVTATRVFVGSGNGSLYALDRATGRLVWAFAAGSPVHSSPAVANGLVVAATLAGRIFAVDESTGRLRWSIQTGALLPRNHPQAGAWDWYVGSAVITGSTAIIGAGDGNVYALDLATGKERWRAKTGGRVRATPSVHDGVAVVGSGDGRVYALDVATGGTRWVHHTIGDTLDLEKAGYDRRTIQSTAAVADGAVLFGSRDGGFYALDFATGERRWRASHGGSWVVGSPAARDGRAYVGSSDGHFIHAVEIAGGREVWRTPTVGNVLSSPAVVGDLVLAGVGYTNAGRGELLAFDAATGAIRWRLQFGDAVWSSPVVSGNEIFIGSDDGAVVAIHEVSPAVPRLAVYHDSTQTSRPLVAGSRLTFEYFRAIGYEVLDADSLARFLAARIADDAPSVVVFATDVVPRTVMPVAADTVLVRRYLNAGGKVVWTGGPFGALVRDSIGRPVRWDMQRAERVIGVSLATLEFDQNAAHPTAEGRRWGIDRWFRGEFAVAASAVTTPLAVDELGKTAAWVRTYRADRPGSGFVQLWGLGTNLDRLPFVRAAAEHGLVRGAPMP